MKNTNVDVCRKIAKKFWGDCYSRKGYGKTQINRLRRRLGKEICRKGGQDD